jgi:transcriptional regulator with XRE-family HTH domain
MAGLRAKDISRFENGDHPSPRIARRIAQALGLSVGQLFGNGRTGQGSTVSGTPAEVLRQARIECGLSVADLAARLKVHPATAGDYERGRLKITLARAIAIEKVLGLPAAALVGLPTVLENVECPGCHFRVKPLKNRCPRCGLSLAEKLRLIQISSRRIQPR